MPRSEWKIPTTHWPYAAMSQREIGAPVEALRSGLLFAGIVRKPQDDGDKFTVTADSITAILARHIPAMMIQPDCNYHLYDPLTCRVLRAIYETTAQIYSIDNAALPPTVVLSLLFSTAQRRTAGWFDQGWIEAGEEASYCVRTIIGSYYDDDLSQLTLYLNAPLNSGGVVPIAGDLVQIIPGCDGKASTCKTKFNNFVNFGGFVAVPDQSLSLIAQDNSVSQGNKK